MAEDKKTLEFLKSKFRDYYENCELYLPDKFERREYGFLFFESGMMQRHLGFKTRDNIRKFLVKKVPMHVYHSSAYYEMPNAPNMEEKNWQGADLIFDLDSDHLKGAEAMSYETMLAAVKDEFINLIENYMIDDLGFSKKHITIVFSGARGYHLHVRDPKVIGLGSHERREIVDYLSGPSKEEIYKFVFESEVYDKKEYKNSPKVKSIRKMPRKDDFGWKRKMRFGVENLLNELKEMGREKGIEYLQGFQGIGNATSKSIWDNLFEGRIKRADKMLAEDNLEVFSSDKNRDAFLEVVIESQKVKLEGEADEPVTSDTKRLIRLPTSLHGKTGLLVKPIGFDELDGFDPLKDAIPSSFSSEPIKVNVTQPIDMELGGEKFNLSRGISKIPEYAAIFFMCRRSAAVA